MLLIIPKRKSKPAGPRRKRFNGLYRILISKTYMMAVFWVGLGLVSYTNPDQANAQIRELKADQILEGDHQQPWVIEADEIAYDRQLDRYTARGNVKISKKDIQLTSIGKWVPLKMPICSLKKTIFISQQTKSRKQAKIHTALMRPA